MAKTSPAEFFNQVKAETKKVVWPSRKDTIRTALLVVMMTVLLGVFFLVVDSAFQAIVNFLLGLAK